MLQRIDLLADHAAHALRNFEVQLREWAHERPVLIHPDNVPPLGEELQEAGDEQRVAFGLPPDERGQLGGEVVRGETRVEVAGYVFIAQRAERDLLAQVVRLHLQLVILQNVIANL